MNKYVYIIIISLLSFISCKENKDTVTPIPKGIFFKGFINEKSKSLTVGINGYLDTYFDSTRKIGDTVKFLTGIKLYQGSSGYYIASKEKIVFELVNIPFADTASKKDSLWHIMMSNRTSIPFYNASSADSNKSMGLRIRWCDYQGMWYSTEKVAQSGSVTIDTTKDLSSGSVSAHQWFISFEAKLCNNNNTKCFEIKEGKARIKFYNSSMQ
ncbi:MAG: hypothetical protein N2Z72_00425 [Bacteroidales bacterium]|nr:hypothetical protein [Bacteroidales bacterium]